ncbi:hypothetical protein [Sphingomonas abietis]|uniref:Uncharacterized protein n=1 Tax=Sphingomonas abietis TaxID=3012344 RepID=A0ABY7NKN6_9SPHN|nr:hypothetical protein [Sphingomonas abietis]WBO22091.1 hypothetical protein PBT88_18350 [Sphingomonas abietis]
MTIVMLLAMPMLIGAIFPDTPFGTWCREATTAKIIRLLGRIERKHIIMLLIGLIALQAFAAAMPLDMALIGMVDAATYIDALLVIGTMATLRRTSLIWASMRHRLPLMQGRNRRAPQRRQRNRRDRRTKPSNIAANDDADDHGQMLAA